MSTKTKFPRAAALAVARELCAILKPCCLPDRLLVAGSLRRRKPEVGDIELIFVSRFEDRPDPEDLLQQRIPTNLADLAIAELLQTGVLAKRPNVNGGTAWGEKNKLAIHVTSGIPVDLFTASVDTWACQLVCRTGSAESNTRIATVANSRGLRWQPYGLGFEDLRTGEQLIRCRTEQEVFAAIGLPYLEPWERQ